jgi:electron transport complex protein RnfG
MIARRTFLLGMVAMFVPVVVRAERYVEPEEAARLIFPQAQSFAPFEITLSKDQAHEIRKRSGVRVRDRHVTGFEARGPAGTIGWVYVDHVIGKHEFITYAAGIGKADAVAGIEIVEYRETYGFEIRGAGWRKQFRGRTLKDPVKLGKDIENISGATLSCRNVTDGVRRLLATNAVLGR